MSHPQGTEADRLGTGVDYVRVVAGGQLTGGLTGPGEDLGRAYSDGDDKPWNFQQGTMRSCLFERVLLASMWGKVYAEQE